MENNKKMILAIDYNAVQLNIFKNLLANRVLLTLN